MMKFLLCFWKMQFTIDESGYSLLFWAIFLQNENKILFSNGPFPSFFPDVCHLRLRHIGQFVDATEVEIIYWPNCIQFSEESDWNGKVSQNIGVFGLFTEKIDAFFEKKLEFSFETEKVESLL